MNSMKNIFNSLIIIIFCLSPLFVFSQKEIYAISFPTKEKNSIKASIAAPDKGKDKVIYGGDWGFSQYIHLCPTYKFTLKGTSKNGNTLGNPININLASSDVRAYKEYVEKQIKEYSGEDFFSKIKFKAVDVVYPDSLQAFISSGRQNVTLKHCKAKYFYYYEFSIDTIATYHIGIALDSMGTIISKFDFPSKADYIPLDLHYTYDGLISIAKKSQHNIEPIESIRLSYDGNKKRFVWYITQELVNPKAGINCINEVVIDATDLKKTKNTKKKVKVWF